MEFARVSPTTRRLRIVSARVLTPPSRRPKVSPPSPVPPRSIRCLPSPSSSPRFPAHGRLLALGRCAVGDHGPGGVDDEGRRPGPRRRRAPRARLYEKTDRRGTHSTIATAPGRHEGPFEAGELASRRRICASLSSVKPPDHHAASLGSLTPWACETSRTRQPSHLICCDSDRGGLDRRGWGVDSDSGFDPS